MRDFVFVRKNKMPAFVKITFLIIVFMFLLNEAFALGITPARTTINFEPGAKGEVSFSVLNTENKKMKIVFSVRGELSEFIKLEKSEVEFLPNETSKNFVYKYELPEEIKPGLHTAEIIVAELPTLSEEQAFFGTAVGLITQFHVLAPYPDKYVDVDLNVLNAERDSITAFIVSIVSRGKLEIENAKAVIDIYTISNKKIDSVDTNSFASLKPGSMAELTGNWLAKAPAGDYLARATLFYDNKSRTIEKQFTIKGSALKVLGFKVEDFVLGEVVKLKILVENEQDKELKGVFANLLIFNKAGQVVADIKSPLENIPPTSKKELVAYWDTSGFEEGEYSGKLLIKYEEKLNENDLLLKISENNLEVKGLSYLSKENSFGAVNYITLLFFLVIILVIINLAWFVFFRKFMKRKIKNRGPAKLTGDKKRR